MMRALAVAAVLALLAATASAQQANPVMDNYRAYQSALARDDLAAAEASAVAALQAAEAASDSRAGALAQNLATVRFLRGDASGAIEPAQEAVTLAELNSSESLPLARLLLARVELAAGRSGAAERLAAALETAQVSQAPPTEVYDAAFELALWATANQRPDFALTGWSTADQYAEGARFPEAYARARAKLGYAVTLIQQQVQSRGARTFDPELTTEAYAELNQAYRLLTTYAAQDLPSGELTLAQQTFAQVLAWSAVLRAKMRSDGTPLPQNIVAQGDADGMTEELGPPQSLVTPRCWLRPAFSRPIEYPSSAAGRGELAGAAVRVRINAAGRVESTEVVALVGSEDFEEAINDAGWRAERRPDSPANCRMDMTVIWSVSFSMDGSPSHPDRRTTRRSY